MKKKGFYLLLGILLLLNISSVLGAGLDEAFGILKQDFNIPHLYSNYGDVIESIIYMTIFIALSLKLTEKNEGWNTRAGKTVMVTTGIALGIGTTLAFNQWGITLAKIGYYAGLIIMLGLIWAIYKLFSLVDGKRTSGGLFFSSFGILLGLFLGNRLTGGRLHTFLGEIPYVGPIYRLSIAILFIVMFITFIMMIGGAVRRRNYMGAGPAPGQGGFLNGLQNIITGANGVSDAWRNRTFLRGTPATLVGPLNNAMTRMQMFMQAVNNAVNLRRPMHQNELDTLDEFANQANQALNTLINHADFGQMSRVDAQELVNHITGMATAYHQMLNLP